MKGIFGFGFLFAFAVAGFGGELRVATLDMQRVTEGYFKAQEAARELKAREVSFLKELETLRLEGRKLASEVEDLRRLSLENALSARERDEKQKSFELKLAEVQAFGLRYDETRSQREAELRAQALRMNKSVLDDVMTATRALGEKEGFNLILNANRANPIASDVLFAKDVEDVTEKVLASLNTTRRLPREAP